MWDPAPAVAAVVGQERAERFVYGTEFDFAARNHAQRRNGADGHDG